MVPAVPPPSPDIKPNFIDPPSTGPLQVYVTSVILAFVILFFFNRVYVKLCLMKKATWDDATIFVAMLGSVAYYTACTWGVQKAGVGRHPWDISVAVTVSRDMLVPSWLSAVLSPPTFLFLKTSFFILYLSLFDQLRWARWCSWIGLVATALTYMVLTVLGFAWATPPGSKLGEFWQTFNSGGPTVLAISVPQAIIGLITDLYILSIPIIGVWRLNLSAKRKVGVLLIFFSGIMACVCSACSIYFRLNLVHGRDMSYGMPLVNIATMGEMFVGIIVACMPTAAYTFRHMRKHQIYQRFLSTFHPKTSRSTIKSPLEPAENNHSEPNSLKSTDKKYARYLDLGGLTTINSTIVEGDSMSKGSTVTNGSMV